MSTPKIALSFLWVACLAAVLLPGSSFVLSIGRAVFWLLVVIHAIECVAFLGRLRKARGSLGRHIVQTFLFGVFHIRELDEPAAG